LLEGGRGTSYHSPTWYLTQDLCMTRGLRVELNPTWAVKEHSSGFFTWYLIQDLCMTDGLRVELNPTSSRKGA
jgi:hypothetical protein